MGGSSITVVFIPYWPYQIARSVGTMTTSSLLSFKPSSVAKICWKSPIDAAIWIPGLVAIPSGCLVVPSLLSGMVKPWAVNFEAPRNNKGNLPRIVVLDHFRSRCFLVFRLILMSVYPFQGMLGFDPHFRPTDYCFFSWKPTRHGQNRRGYNFALVGSPKDT